MSVSAANVYALPVEVNLNQKTATGGGVQALAISVPDQYLLGQGVDLDLGRGASTCLQAQTPELGIGTGGSVSVFGTYTQRELEHDMAKSANFGVSVGKFSASGSSSFSSYSKDRQFSFVFRMKSEFYHENLIYRTSSLDQFAPVYRGMIDSGDTVGFRRSCGDRFIQSIKRGAAMYATVRVDFASQEDYNIATQNGSASISIGSFSGSGGASFTESLRKKGVQGSLTIIGAQRGGDPEKLTQLFGGANGAANIASCSIQGDTAACLNMITNVILYGDAFAAQFTANTTRYEVLEYVTQSYLQAYGIPQVLRHPDVTPTVIQMRNQLETTLDNHYDHLLLANNVYDILNTRYYKTRANDQLSYINFVVEPNIADISLSGRECWFNPTTCHLFYIPLFPADGSINADGSFNTAPTTNPDGSPASSSLLDLDPNRALYPAVLSPQIFSLGGSEAFYAASNGDYCKIYDQRHENVCAGTSGLAGAICKIVNPGGVKAINIYPTGGSFTVPVQSDLAKVNSNMDRVPDCKQPTNNIYAESNAHPYACTVSVVTTPAQRVCSGGSGWFGRICFNIPATTTRTLNCPSPIPGKNCATPSTIQDLYNVIRCP